MPENLSFVIEGKLAGSAHPGRWMDLEQDLAGLRRLGVAAIVSLTGNPLPADMLDAQGIEGHHIPISDFTPPTLDQIRDFTAFVQNRISRDAGAVLVHCQAGIGRTGTMLATYLVTTGMSAAEAIREIRRLRPGSIETISQEDAVRMWERALRAAPGK